MSHAAAFPSFMRVLPQRPWQSLTKLWEQMPVRRGSRSQEKAVVVSRAWPRWAGEGPRRPSFQTPKAAADFRTLRATTVYSLHPTLAVHSIVAATFTKQQIHDSRAASYGGVNIRLLSLFYESNSL